MKPSYSTLVRSLYGALAALMIFPALPAQAEGPIDHLKKRRRQIHEKIGEIFFGLGRKIEDAADRVDGHMEPVPPPPGYRGAPPPYRDDPIGKRRIQTGSWSCGTSSAASPAVLV